MGHTVHRHAHLDGPTTERFIGSIKPRQRDHPTFWKNWVYRMRWLLFIIIVGLAYRGCGGLQADAIIDCRHEGVLAPRLQHPRPHHQIVPTQRGGGQGIPGHGGVKRLEMGEGPGDVRVKDTGRGDSQRPRGAFDSTNCTIRQLQPS